MSKKWTIEEAKSYIVKVLKGKQQTGLTYCSAVDYLMNHTNARIEQNLLTMKDNENDSSDSFG